MCLGAYTSEEIFPMRIHRDLAVHLVHNSNIFIKNKNKYKGLRAGVHGDARPKITSMPKFT